MHRCYAVPAVHSKAKSICKQARKQIARKIMHSKTMAGQSHGWITTARVLRRVGFGVTGAQVDAVAKQNWADYVDAALRADPAADPGAVATPMPSPPTLRGPGKGASVADRKEFNQRVNEQLTELSGWWLRRMVAVHQPIHEKLTLLWHNHFATSAEKVRSASDMAAQNQKLRTQSLGDFRTLAYSMLTDAAMMHWLDAQTSTAKAPNENLAREFMELFALGHGNGYSEDDVRQSARALTGWTIRPATGQTMMVPKRHDHTAKTIFGVTKNFDAAGFCDAVLAQPKSPQYVAGRLWQQLASDTPAVRAVSGSVCRRVRRSQRLASANSRDSHRRRIRRQPSGDRQHPGRVACRSDADIAGPHRQSGAAENGQHHVAGAGPASVLPTGRRWLAARPGLDVHRQRRRANAGGKSVRAQR